LARSRILALIAFVAVASLSPACGDETLHLGAPGGAGAPDTAPPTSSGGSEPAQTGGDGPVCVEDCEEDLCSSCEPSQIACALDDFECTPCEADSECKEHRICDPLSGSCQRGCYDNDDCPDWRPLCDEGRGVCVDCFRDSHCDRAAQCVLGFCVDCRECR
jgi:hypothetical protein